MNNRDIKRLGNLVTGILRDSYSLRHDRTDTPLRYAAPFEPVLQRTSVSIEANGESIPIDELGHLLKALLDERFAAWLLTSEGQESQKAALKRAIYAGATNPAFSPSAAQEKAEAIFSPFAATIRVLEENGYQVTKK